MVNKNNSAYFIKLDIFRKQFDQGMETIEKYAILTEHGSLINNSFAVTTEV